MHRSLQQLLPRYILPLVAGSTIGMMGCKDLTGSTSLPSGIQNPSTFDTPAGALGMWAEAMHAIKSALPSYLVDTGLLADELESNATGASGGGATGATFVTGGALDERILPEQGLGVIGTNADNDYNALQQFRGFASQALGALVTYDTGKATQGNPIALRSQLYALQGYTEILLADFFCSGVPLSTLDFQKDYTYHAGSTTDAVYADAIGKLDTAYALASASDSVALQNLALVLKGRAWLDQGQYDSAAAAVAVVPDTFRYQVNMQTATQGGYLGVPGAWVFTSATVSNNEGRNGLPYVSGDPRVDVTTVAEIGTVILLLNGGEIGNSETNVIPLTVPTKYCCSLADNFNIPFTVADGIEAQLIRAEVKLHNNPNDPAWLTILNHLRATAPIPGTTQPQPNLLPSLTDPGASANDVARVSLLFHERAFWMFLTGHRQGDLRRLTRKYGRQQNQVYPTGSYLAPGTGLYGNAVAAPVPGNEFINSQFHGCLPE